MSDPVTWLGYLWSLCFRPFKLTWRESDNTIHRLMQVFASLGERVEVDIYWVRAQFHLYRMSWWALLKRGAELEFPKLYNEDYETYRGRPLNAYAIFQRGGTIPGMILAIQTLGFSSVEVVEHYRTVGQSQWAQFSVVVPLEEFTLLGLDYHEVDRLIWKLKPAHTLGKIRRGCFRCDNPDSLTDRDWLCI